MSEEIWMLKEEESSFGPLWPYVADDEVTDIDYNNGQLWITRTDAIPFPVNLDGVTEQLMHDLAIRAGSDIGKNFNAKENIMCADTPSLRITASHESISGHIAVSIRKSLPKLRFDYAEAVSTGVASAEVLNLIINCVLAHQNFIFCGTPGTGKTEIGKFFSAYIRPYEKVVSIADCEEWHYSKINPGKSCVEFRCDFSELERVLAATLRLNPEWIIFQESRSTEMNYLLKAWSNGVHNMSTLHVDDTLDVPDRVLQMIDVKEPPENLLNQIYSKVGVAVLMKRAIKDGRYKRYIDQVRFYYRKNGKNESSLVVENGVLDMKQMPEFIQKEIEELNGRGILEKPVGNEVIKDGQE